MNIPRMMNTAKPIYETGIRNLNSFVSVLYSPLLIVIPACVLFYSAFGSSDWFISAESAVVSSMILLSYVIMGVLTFYDSRKFIIRHKFYENRIEIEYPFYSGRPSFVVKHEDIVDCHWAKSDRGGKYTPS